MRLLGRIIRRLLPRHLAANMTSRVEGSSTRFSRGPRGLMHADDGVDSIYFYTWRRAGRYSRNGIQKIFRGMLDKYVPDWYELNPDCTVIDIGANIGEFAMAVAPRIGKVIAIEPDELAYACLKENAKISPGVIFPVNYGVGECTGKKTLFLASDTADTSFIEPDKYSEKIEVLIYTLKDLLSKLEVDFNKIGLIKIEAEGYEPEVLQGCLPSLKVKYYSVNCDPERLGESPLEEVRELLERNGYSVVENGYKVYGVLNV